MEIYNRIKGQFAGEEEHALDSWRLLGKNAKERAEREWERISWRHSLPSGASPASIAFVSTLSAYWKELKGRRMTVWGEERQTVIRRV